MDAGWMDKWMDLWLFSWLVSWMDGLMDRWRMVERREGLSDGWTNGRTDRWIVGQADVMSNGHLRVISII